MLITTWSEPDRYVKHSLPLETDQGVEILPHILFQQSVDKFRASIGLEPLYATDSITQGAL